MSIKVGHWRQLPQLPLITTASVGQSERLRLRTTVEHVSVMVQAGGEEPDWFFIIESDENKHRGGAGGEPGRSWCSGI